VTAEEKTEVVENCAHLEKLRLSKVLPYALTEHGALMAASVLNSEKAVETSLFVIHNFVRHREMDELGVRTGDIGVPTFAMHSIRELAGSLDACYLHAALRHYYA